MRVLDSGMLRDTEAVCLDEPGVGGACHEYAIKHAGENDVYTRVSFQIGAAVDTGVNGCQNEELVAILIDRMRGFQSGPFPCYENQCALKCFEDALGWLNARTRHRQSRGVEGKSVK